MARKHRKTTPYHPEELRWEKSDCNPSSTHNEDIVDPWSERDTELEAETAKSDLSFEQVQKSSLSHIETQSSEDPSDEIEFSEKLIRSFDDFPSDEFPAEENFDSYDLDNENLDTLENLMHDFDENAQQSPWEITSSETDSSFHANRNASIISNMLIVKNPVEQIRATEYLTDIFLKHPHSATFGAFKNMVAKGLSFTELETIIDLRHTWMERPDWWLYRYKGEIKTIRQGQRALSWKLARQICQARWEFPPDAMIEEAWLEEWLHFKPEIDFMKFPMGYHSFPSFIAEKVKHKDEEFLHDGLQMQAIFNREVESMDAPTWKKQYPNYQDTCHDRYAVKAIHQPPSENTGE